MGPRYVGVYPTNDSRANRDVSGDEKGEGGPTAHNKLFVDSIHCHFLIFVDVFLLQRDEKLKNKFLATATSGMCGILI